MKTLIDREQPTNIFYILVPASKHARKIDRCKNHRKGVISIVHPNMSIRREKEKISKISAPSRSASESSPSSLPIFTLPILVQALIRFRPVQHLQELVRPDPQPRVQVSLRTLDVVVQVIPEELDLRDGGC